MLPFYYVLVAESTEFLDLIAVINVSSKYLRKQKRVQGHHGSLLVCCRYLILPGMTVQKLFAELSISV